MLVVEDQAPLRNALLSVLKSHGYQAHGVGSAEEAWDMLQHNGQEPCWMVVDVDLPGMCGLDFVRIVKAIRPRIQPIMVTAADPSRVGKFCDLHDVPYFPKPLDVPEFLKHIAHRPVA